VSRDVPILVPSLELPNSVVVVVAWLVRLGEAVVEGDRLVEIACGAVSWEIDAPASGILLEKRYDVDSEVPPGEVLGIIRVR
jgi:pyruvate/2-oxoglutarate dehydrogenase complex dihydrolipoamide acyltransferase (E2) component